MKEKRLIKWICPFCYCVWWEDDNTESTFGHCPYCNKNFEKEYVE